jgi:cobalt-zinc-cadmium efflux system membrane fusion protein
MKTLLLTTTLSACWLLSACSKPAESPAPTPGDASASTPAEGDEHAGEAEHADTTVIPLKIARDSGIRVAPAAAGTIADAHEVQGLLTPVDGRIAQAVARFPGPVRSLRANVGDTVRAGQALASVESNLSLTTYTVTAPIAGVVTARNAQIGGAVGEGAPLFEIADLSTLWVDLHIFGRDTQHITAGVPVTVTRMTDGVSETTTLERVLPGTATASQSTVARAILHNRDGLWRPGAAVKARIVVASTPAALVVPLTALQTLEGREVVFVRTGEDTYTAHAVELGARDSTQVAVLSGIALGDVVVVEQSYVVKADIGKGSAEHAH